MIPLRIKVDANADEPFVVRLRSLEGWAADDIWFAVDARDVVLERVSEAAVYRGEGGSIRIHGIDPSHVDGDVLLVNPRRGVADRLVRASSPHNTFLVTERCDQLCVMCSQPPKAHHVDMFPHFETAALLAPEGATIGISGGEPTLYKEELLNFLERTMEKRQDLRFHILTNGQHFEEADMSTMRSLERERIILGVPLYASKPEVHDEIVGKEGAHSRLMESLGFLCRAGAQVELRTVLMDPNAFGLPALARFITTTLPFVQTWAIMQLESIGYARQNWQRLFYDSSVGFDVIGRALDLVRSRGIDAQLYNFPLCTVPAAYRHLSPPTISDWKRAYLDECQGCAIQGRCGGFFEWHPKKHGYANLGAQS